MWLPIVQFPSIVVDNLSYFVSLVDVSYQRTGALLLESAWSI